MLLDMELKSVAKVCDPDFQNTWRKLNFILEMSAVLESEMLERSQSHAQNARLQAEAACFASFQAELLSDQAVHRSQVAKVLTDVARRKVQLLETLEAYHHLAWDKVAEYADRYATTWHIKTRDLAASLPGKLQPWLQQAQLT